MRKFFVLLGAALVLFVGFTVAVTARYHSEQPIVEPVPEVAIPDAAAERLAGSLRIRTISSEDPAAFDADAFGTLHQYLQAAFPRVHTQLRRETVATHSLLYTWQGSDSSLNPILLIGHLDVVPVETGTQEKWQQDPAGRNECPSPERRGRPIISAVSHICVLSGQPASLWREAGRV